ncbi:carboxylesterase family protein [Streptomyces sp. NBC_00016]|uniref:carboxylesterase family protein n=1 Tax=Streptomyces sp. NBC_00016 TaxID=2975622 RepID=UPI00324A83AE
MVADFDPDRPCDRKGVVSVQPDSGDWLEADNGMGEDCLNLNVWAPEQPTGTALPVAVYIHGGGFEYGANTQITSNAAGLAASGRVVSVSVNYRLGALGALSLSQYGGRLAEASNLGLQDVIAALAWVKQNIASFGGDPDDVTVFGHSAGAYSTLGLLGTSSADGLYRRLAGFSGAPSRLVPAWWAEELAERFVTELGVAGNPDKLIDLDAASLVAALRKVCPTDLGVRGGMDNQSLGVVLDAEQPGGVVHAHPLEVLASGSHRDIDILLSTAGDEMGWWVANDLDRFDPHTVDRVTDEFAGWRIPRSRAKRIVDTYDQGGRTPAEVRAASLTDYIFTLPAARGALAHAAAGGNAHLLMIGPAEGAPAVHGTEMYALVGQGAALNRPTVTRVSATSSSTSSPASRPACGPPSRTGPPREVSATLPTSPAPTTRQSSTCSGTSPAPDGRRTIRNSAGPPRADHLGSCAWSPAGPSHGASTVRSSV